MMLSIMHLHAGLCLVLLSIFVYQIEMREKLDVLVGAVIRRYYGQEKSRHHG
jgi:hypothetical protein